MQVSAVVYEFAGFCRDGCPCNGTRTACAGFGKGAAHFLHVGHFVLPTDTAAECVSGSGGVCRYGKFVSAFGNVYAAVFLPFHIGDFPYRSGRRFNVIDTADAFRALIDEYVPRGECVSRYKIALYVFDRFFARSERSYVYGVRPCAQHCFFGVSDDVAERLRPAKYFYRCHKPTIALPRFPRYMDFSREKSANGGECAQVKFLIALFFKKSI